MYGIVFGDSAWRKGTWRTKHTMYLSHFTDGETTTTPPDRFGPGCAALPPAWHSTTKKKEILLDELERVSPAFDPDKSAERFDARHLLLTALDSLDADQRAVFVLHDIEGRSIPEVQDRLYHRLAGTPVLPLLPTAAAGSGALSAKTAVSLAGVKSISLIAAISAGIGLTGVAGWYVYRGTAGSDAPNAAAPASMHRRPPSNGERAVRRTASSRIRIRRRSCRRI